MRKRRAILYNDDPLLLEFFRDVFTAMDYEVIDVGKAVACPLSRKAAGACAGPCADVMLMDYRIRGSSSIFLLLAQNTKGCRIPNQNRAVMSGSFDDASLQALSDTGCAFFQKPVLLSILYDWISDCERRSDLAQPLISRRQNIRHATAYEIQCVVDRTGQVLDAMVINMSDDGFCVRLSSPLPERETVHIRSKPPVIPCDAASVCWVRNENNTYHAGLICQ